MTLLLAPAELDARRRVARGSLSELAEGLRRELQPLIEGEDYPPYKDGLPDYVKIKGVAVKKKLNTDFKP